jgi:zinc and cadmium transporter
MVVPLMAPLTLLAYYCLLILVASIVGGVIPLWFHLTHRSMQIAVSFVAGVMLGVGVLHMLPQAVSGAIAAAPNEPAAEAVTRTMLWLLAGMLVMFFIERLFQYHHHDVPEGLEADHPHADHLSEGVGEAPSPRPSPRHGESATSGRGGRHDFTWTGAALGLVLHSVLNGVALAAATQHGSHGASLAGFGTFLVVFLHKPFDSMTIGMLMARGRWSLPWRHTVNGLFALAIPLGVLVFYLGLMPEGAAPSSGRQLFVDYALAFSAGTFLCISLSDLLPELQFHRHDRLSLSLALMMGLAVAVAVLVIEDHGGHAHQTTTDPLSMEEGSLCGWNGGNGVAGKKPKSYLRQATVAIVDSVQFARREYRRDRWVGDVGA